jgi:hypothetical protein
MGRECGGAVASAESPSKKPAVPCKTPGSQPETPVEESCKSPVEIDVAHVPVEEHCGGAVPVISLRVACLDCSSLVSLDLTVPAQELIGEVKRAFGEVSGVL